jgi:hypothetical protein
MDMATGMDTVTGTVGMMMIGMMMGLGGLAGVMVGVGIRVTESTWPQITATIRIPTVATLQGTAGIRAPIMITATRVHPRRCEVRLWHKADKDYPRSLNLPYPRSTSFT